VAKKLLTKDFDGLCLGRQMLALLADDECCGVMGLVGECDDAEEYADAVDALPVSRGASFTRSKASAKLCR
jgi:hypothetical protein